MYKYVVQIRWDAAGKFTYIVDGSDRGKAIVKAEMVRNEITSKLRELGSIDPATSCTIEKVDKIL